jgi:predicted amidohydrolase YtcJ
VLLHAIEEHAVVSACSAIEQALETYPKADHRHRIEHCSVCRPALAKRLASAGIVVATQPAFVYYNGERYLSTVPQEDLAHLYPVATLIRHGVPVAGSSDCPVVPPNPLIGIYAAVSRKSENGEPVLPGEKIAPLEALSLFTHNAARATRTETTRGSIRPGKAADMVVLSGDPTGVPEEAIKDIQVDMTIIDGKVVWQRT